MQAILRWLGFFRRKKHYQVRPLEDAIGFYLTNHVRFLEDARTLLGELEIAVQDVRQMWPLPLSETVRDPNNYPRLKALTSRRDILSDSVLIFSTMAVEGFLNYYGVARLGENQYIRNFERLGLLAKLRTLLRVCDSVSIGKNHAISIVVNNLAQARNSLVHPKVTEVPGYVPGELRPGAQVPEAGREAVTNMNRFFQEFRILVPKAGHLLP